jgi:benzoyl-CoA reductase/2-hydroxyglutaryl-CoA dehydratase subunit BcrC/BadD/HgdB
MESKSKGNRHINRLKSSKLVRPFVDKMYREGVEAAENGKPVAWCMVNWWEADLVLRAMGVTPIYPENYGAVSAAKGMAPKYQALSDAEGFPTHLCGYARNGLGYSAEMKKLGRIPADAPLGGMAEPMLLVGSGILCDTRFKWFQALRQYWDVPSWTFDTPSFDPVEDIRPDAHKNNIQYKVERLRAFISFLEQLLRKKMDMDLLEQYISNQEAVFKIWWEINELRKARPCPIHSRDFWTLMVLGYYMTWDPESLDLYRQVFNEAKERVDSGVGAIAEEKYRLIFSELPPWHSLGFFEKLAERGWNFVIESAMYHPPEPIEFDISNDPVERIAANNYWFQVDHLIKAKRKGYPVIGPMLPQAYLNWGIEYEADGILTHSLLSCRTCTYWLTHIANSLQTELSVPGMNIEGDIVDFSVFDPDSVLQNVSAFEDAMDHHRTIRKK